MLIKIVILFLFGFILFSLTKALFSLLNSKSSAQMAKALTWRISLSLGVFALLLLAFVLGWIKPHGFMTKLTSLDQNKAKIEKTTPINAHEYTR